MVDLDEAVSGRGDFEGCVMTEVVVVEGVRRNGGC